MLKSFPNICLPLPKNSRGWSINSVYPEIDLWEGGLLLKRCIGEEVRVEAGIFSEEHVEIKRFL
ncbi:hypothetical protein B1F79_01855 [Coxiella-like endosymbiont of Rhipicephalus sanguineus]|nr:hypothetical protein [Coxiella-like endosymbiont of Rhipicephalus sanguineus]